MADLPTGWAANLPVGYHVGAAEQDARISAGGEEVTKPDGAKEEWMIEGGSPNSLLRHGLNKDSLPVGTEIVVDGYQARDHSLLRANGRNVTYPDGRKLFLGSSGPGAPPNDATPADKAKPN